MPTIEDWLPEIKNRNQSRVLGGSPGFESKKEMKHLQIVSEAEFDAIPHLLRIKPIKNARFNPFEREVNHLNLNPLPAAGFLLT